MNTAGKILTTLIAMLLFVTPLSAQTVKLANGEWAPYQSESLKENGFISQFVKEIFEGEGYQVEFVFSSLEKGV